jgi:NADPH:quinone reductase-like Zn-dependent oxidoreductase
MARTIRIHAQGGPEVLQIEDLDDRRAGRRRGAHPRRGVGLNRAEAMYRAGRYPVPCELPSRMGYEGVGTIEALGRGVDGFAVGERVCVLPMTTPAHGPVGRAGDRPGAHPAALPRPA